MNTALAYLDEAAPLGSPLYYSLLKCDASKRKPVLAIHAFYQGLESVLYSTQETSIAQAKWHWWKSEVAKIALGRPSHPLVLLIQEQAKSCFIDPQSLIDLIDAVEEKQKGFVSVEHLISHTYQSAGLREQMIAKMLDSDRSQSESGINEMALYIDWVSQIQNLHHLVKHGVPIFAEEELQAFDLDYLNFTEKKNAVALKNVLEKRMETGRKILDEAFGKLSASQKTLHPYLFLYCQFSEALIQEIAKAKYPVLEKSIRLTPLRLLWMSLRS